MHRIDSSGALAGGVWSEGNPTLGVLATEIDADWMQSVQEELVAVVVAGGLTLDKPDRTQVLAAIRKLLVNAVPVGKVIHGYFASAPAGFLACNGALFSRAAYPALWAHVSAAGFVTPEVTWLASAWTMFSAGDGATNFRVPDLRGEFVRGWDGGRGVDPGRVVGSWQTDAFKAHSHEMGSEGGGGSNIATPVDSGGVDETAAGSPTSIVGGVETRPRNAALMWCVRA